MTEVLLVNCAMGYVVINFKLLIDAGYLSLYLDILLHGDVYCFQVKMLHLEHTLSIKNNENPFQILPYTLLFCQMVKKWLQLHLRAFRFYF